MEPVLGHVGRGEVELEAAAATLLLDIDCRVLLAVHLQGKTQIKTKIKVTKKYKNCLANGNIAL